MFLAGEMLSASSSILPAPGSYRSGALNDPHYVLPSLEHAAGCGEQVGRAKLTLGSSAVAFVVLLVTSPLPRNAPGTI